MLTAPLSRLLLIGTLLLLPSCGMVDSLLFAPADAGPPPMSQQEAAAAVEQVQHAAVADLALQGVTPESATQEQIQAAVKRAATQALEERAAAAAADAPRELSPIANAVLTAVKVLNPGWGTAVTAASVLLALSRKQSRGHLATALGAVGTAVAEVAPYDGRVHAPEALTAIASAGGSLLSAFAAALQPKQAAPAAVAASAG